MSLQAKIGKYGHFEFTACCEANIAPKAVNCQPRPEALFLTATRRAVTLILSIYPINNLHIISYDQQPIVTTNKPSDHSLYDFLL